MQKTGEALKAKAKKRRGFLPALFLAILFLLVFLLLLFFVPPTNQLVIALFGLLFFLSVFFSSSLLFGSSKRGLLLSIGLTIFGLLGYYGAGTWLNFILLMGIIVAIDYLL